MKHLIINEQIEELRILMHEVALDKELTDYRVVSISSKLDGLINEFYMLNRQKFDSFEESFRVAKM